MKSDIVISGGGMVGSALACALGQSGAFSSIKLVSASKKPEPPSSAYPDPKVLTITSTSQKFMRSIGTWDLLDQTRTVGFNNMKIWDFFGTGSMDFEESFGWFVEKNWVAHANLKKAMELDSVEVLTETNIRNLRKQDGSVMIQLENGEDIEASLVVGADGKNSLVRNSFGISTWKWEYPYHGLLCTVQSEFPLLEPSQKYLKSGPIALLPLWENYTAVVWSASPSEILRLKKLEKPKFIKELNSALSSENQSEFPSYSTVSPPTFSEVVSERSNFPYLMQHSTSFTDQGVALVGGAAHTVHPMSGQGFNLGVYDVMNLANVLIEASKNGKEPGDANTLMAYGWRARMYSSLLAAFEQSVLWAYWDLQPLHYARNLQYAIIDAIPPLKRAVEEGVSGKYFVPSEWLWTTHIPEDEKPNN